MIRDKSVNPASPEGPDHKSSTGRFSGRHGAFAPGFPCMSVMCVRMLVLALASMVSSGCATYKPMPLDEVRLSRALEAPSGNELARGAAELRNPRLPRIKLDFTKPLDDRELGVVAVLSNPELKALRVREKVAQAQVFDAGLLPDPRISASLENPVSGAGAVEGYKAGVDWLISALITRPADERIAMTSARKVRWDIAWHEWLVANRARLLARREIFLERRLRVAGEEEQNAKLLLDALQRGLKRKDINGETIEAQLAAYMNARQRLMSLEGETEGARQELNRVLGLPPGDRLQLAGHIPAARPPASPQVLFERARNDRLDLLALRAGYESQEAKLYRAVLGQYPRFSLGLDTARDTEGVRTIGISISLDLPLFNRNQGAIAVEEATREQLYREYADRLHQTRADIAALTAELDRIERERTSIHEKQPELDRIEKGVAAALQRGEATLTAFVTARAAILAQRLRLLELDQAAAEREVALDTAVGSGWEQ